MRKILLGITLVLGITLTGCVIPEDNTEYLTQDEVDTMIAEAIADYQANQPAPLTEQEIEDKIAAALVGISSELTAEEIEELIEELMPDNVVSTTFDLASFSEAVSAMIDEVYTGMFGVRICSEVETIDGETGCVTASSGSGVIYKRELSTTAFKYDYYLVTNQHVVDGALDITLVYEKNGLQFFIEDDENTLLGEDTQTDLAVVKFSSDEEFEVIEFSDSSLLTPGDFVFAVGNPLGFEYFGTVTMGVIGGTTRYYNERIEGGFDATVLQHDAAINPGNSGGALLDINGKLVGINFSKIVDEDVSGIGFAIPSNTVHRIVTDIEEQGFASKPYVGISTFASVNFCGLDYGVCISGVAEGLPADLAGIQEGDIIVGYLNDGQTEFQEILNFNDLREAILSSSVGETVTIKYIRDGVEATTTLTIIERPVS